MGVIKSKRLDTIKKICAKNLKKSNFTFMNLPLCGCQNIHRLQDSAFLL